MLKLFLNNLSTKFEYARLSSLCEEKNRITIEFMYTYCLHSDITSKNMM